MKRISDILKGTAVGLANIVAGLSGGTIAVLLNIYERLIDDISNVVNHPIKVLKDLWGILLGVFFGLLIGAVVIKRVYEGSPIITSSIFCGLVISGIPFLFSKLKGIKLNYKHYLLFFVMFILVASLPYLTAGSSKSIDFSGQGMLISVGLGALAAVAMIIPGVSGSMIALSLGYYDSLLSIVDDILHGVNVGHNVILAIFVVIGIVIALLSVSKLIKYLLKNHFSYSYSAIIGLVSGSTIAIMISALKSDFYPKHHEWWQWVIGVVAFIVFAILGYMLTLVEGNEENIKMDYKKIGKDKIEEGTNLLVKLINIDSVLDEYIENGDAPFGKGNKEALELVLNTAKEDGFKTLNVDNYAGHIEFGPEDGEVLGVLAHLDVVPVNRDNWDSDPFNAVVTETSIIGRGSTDDKGPLVASYMALKAIKESGLPVSKKVRLILGCDEESGSRSLPRYFSKAGMPKIGFSPDADFPLIYGEKAITGFDIKGSFKDSIVTDFTSGIRYNMVPDTASMTISKDLVSNYTEFLKKNNYKGEVKENRYFAYGLSAHGSTPELGVNAACILAEFLEENNSCEFSRYLTKYLMNSPYGEKLGLDVDGGDMGHLSCNLGFVKTEESSFVLGINLRIPVDNYKDTVVSKLDESFKEFESMSYSNIVIAPIHYVDPNSYLVKTLLGAYQAVTGDYESKPTTIGGGTYAKFIPNCVAFGPEIKGKDNFIHNANEFIDIVDFENAIAIYTKAIYDLIK